MPVFSEAKSSEFHDAARNGNLRLVETLSLDPEVDLNWRNESGSTAFHYACYRGHVDIVRYLLDLKKQSIDYHVADHYGYTPFLEACTYGHVAVINLLVSDKRIDVNKANEDGQTALWRASRLGRVEVVKILLASNRPIEILKRDGRFQKAAVEIAGNPVKEPMESEVAFRERRKRCLAVAWLLESFQKNPLMVRAQLRCELGYPDALAGELFSLVIYISDGYFVVQRSQAEEKTSKAQRFFSLANRLPLDLQAVLCNRVFGLEESIIRRVYSEKGFRKFANQKGF